MTAPFWMYPIPTPSICQLYTQCTAIENSVCQSIAYPIPTTHRHTHTLPPNIPSSFIYSLVVIHITMTHNTYVSHTHYYTGRTCISLPQNAPLLYYTFIIIRFIYIKYTTSKSFIFLLRIFSLSLSISLTLFRRLSLVTRARSASSAFAVLLYMSMSVAQLLNAVLRLSK